jgi:hypothetical protein
MSNLLQSQLETEIAIYNRLIESGRNDSVAKIVLDKLEVKIKALQGLIDEKESRQVDAKHRHTNAIVCYVREVMYRFRNYKNTRDYSIFRVFAKTVLQAQAGTR